MGAPDRRRTGLTVNRPLALVIAGGLLLAAAAPGMVAAQDVEGAPPSVRLRGPPELQDLGQALVLDPATWRSFPGIGTLRQAGVDSLDIWLTPRLDRDVPADMRRSEPWVGGVADPGGRRIVLRTGPALSGPGGLRGVLRHELAHVALSAATGGNYTRWLTEGYAQYAAGEWGWEEAWQLQSTFLRGGAASLRTIDLRFRTHPVEARMGYLLAYTAVHELAALGGEPGLRALFGRLQAGLGLDEAIWRTYGIRAEEFERRWKRSLVDRYGWLYVLSRAGVFWAAVTGLVLLVALRRARRDRRRLAILRAQDRASDAVAGIATGMPGRSPDVSDVNAPFDERSAADGWMETD